LLQLEPDYRQRTLALPGCQDAGSSIAPSPTLGKPGWAQV